MPSGLDLPSVAASSFPAEELHRAERYERFARWELVASQLVLLAVLAVYARRGPGLLRESAAGRIGSGMLLGMLGLGLVWLSQVPFRLVELWWERRHDLAEQGYLESLFANWAELAAEFLFVSFALLVVMALAGRWPRGWWVGAAPVFVGLGLLFAFVLPWLLPDQKPLRDPRLKAETERLARAEGVSDVRIRVLEVSDDTSLPNAAAMGLGPSRRIVVFDTLLDGRFPPGEVDVVLAHELGHLARNHIWKGIAWYALFAFPGAWLIARGTRRRGGMREPDAVPLSLLVLTMLGLAGLPFENLVTRHIEAEADWLALEATRDPASAEALFRRFTDVALADPAPPTWSYLLLDNHPTIEQRIAMARAWRARESVR